MALLRSGVAVPASLHPPDGTLLVEVPDPPLPTPALWAAAGDRACGEGRDSGTASSDGLLVGAGTTPTVAKVLSPSPPECSPSFPAALGCVPAEPFDWSPAASATVLLAGSSPTEDAAGPTPAAGPTLPPLPTASVTAAAGAGVFKFSMNGDTAEMRPVFDKSKGPCAVGSSSTAWWTLPSCQVTVHLTDCGRFWGEAKAKVEGLSDGDGADAGARLAVSGVQPVPS
ncbi:hypothetical protein DUI87_18726 [Hirundo rustica rustica]|uniref:Uncharacterized protein n=1 Tax=Hirundo rustica rustica TaxID=333673 RepID=A0A3M0K2S7_HIRRU|nr:hypothetical protein DUI87_18726 [Hirundo rustica rustica]